MSKYVDRILDEVDFNFERHFDDFEERQEFLEELIEALQHVRRNLEENEECECGEDRDVNLCGTGCCKNTN